MRDALRSIGYFLIWGTLYGFALGVWSTTMIIPVFATAYGLFWGPLVGGICGLICGIIAAVTQTFTFHADIDLGAYRQRASLSFGFLTALAAPIALIATSRTILWEGPYYGFLIPCLIAATFWGLLAAAYTAHFYPLWLARLKSGQEAETSLPPLGWQVPNATADLIRTATNWLTIGVGAVSGAAIHITTLGRFDPGVRRALGLALEGAIVGGIASLFVMVMLAIGNAAMAIFLRQILFSDDGFSISPQTQRRLMSAIAAVFTGISLPLLHLSAPLGPIILIPVMALAALYMYRAYPTFDHVSDKFKRKEKNADLSQDTNRLALDESVLDQTAVDALPHVPLTQARDQKG